MVRALQVTRVTKISSSHTTVVTFRSPRFNSQAGRSPEVYKPYLNAGRACHLLAQVVCPLGEETSQFVPSRHWSDTGCAGAKLAPVESCGLLHGLWSLQHLGSPYLP